MSLLSVVSDVGGVITLLLLFGGAGYGWWSRRRASNFETVRAFSDSVPKRSVAELLKTLKIAIVDDEPQSFPIDHIRAIAGAVQHYGSLRLSEIGSLLAYDIVLLDIAGILEEDKKEGGIEVLKRIRELAGNGRPFVIAVSSKKFKVESNRFFALADDVLDKPVTALRAEERITQLVADSMHFSGISRRLDELIADSKLNLKDRKRLVSKTILYLRGQIAEKAFLDDVIGKYPVKDQLLFERVALEARKCTRHL